MAPFRPSHVPSPPTRPKECSAACAKSELSKAEDSGIVRDTFVWKLEKLLHICPGRIIHEHHIVMLP